MFDEEYLLNLIRNFRDPSEENPIDIEERRVYLTFDQLMEFSIKLVKNENDFHKHIARTVITEETRGCLKACTWVKERVDGTTMVSPVHTKDWWEGFKEGATMCCNAIRARI